jgi:glycosyltransferase involved in cell wall biosynthesis
MTKPSGAFVAKPSSLFLSPEPPFPAIGGGPIRSASIFEYLAERSQVDVITFRQPGDPDPRERFPPGLAHSIHVVDLPVLSKRTPARVLRNLQRAVRGRPPLMDRFSGFEREIAQAVAEKRYDVAIIEHFWCAQYEPLLRPHCGRLYLDLHNIESVWHAKLAASESAAAGLILKRFAQASATLEKKLLPRFDALLVASTSDRARVQALAPAARCVVYPNALPWIQQPQKLDRNVIVFSGNLEYRPNISGIRYFRNRVWPSIRERCPDLICEIVGKNPHSIAELVRDDSRIHVVGPVEDAVERIASARVAVAPLLAGSGTRIKILEAWAAATAVVSTSLGAEGLEYRTGEHLIIADEPSEFSDAVVGMVMDPARRKEIGMAGRAQYERHYTWRTAFAALDRNLNCYNETDLL